MLALIGLLALLLVGVVDAYVAAPRILRARSPLRAEAETPAATPSGSVINKRGLDRVSTVDIASLTETKYMCRCWQSSKYPYCDGAHNAHNKATGDNLGPLCLNKA